MAVIQKLVDYFMNVLMHVRGVAFWFSRLNLISPLCLTFPAVNLVFERPTMESSTKLTKVGPDVAADGKKSGIFDDNTCTQTATSTNPWWQARQKSA